eukprot:12926886-Alexandrium_andersonii.AAC.1
MTLLATGARPTCTVVTCSRDQAVERQDLAKSHGFGGVRVALAILEEDWKGDERWEERRKEGVGGAWHPVR